MSRSAKSFIFRRFPFATLVCWILAAAVVFGITGSYSPERQTDARDFSVSSERIRGRFSILRCVDFFDFNKIRNKVVLTVSK